MSGTIEIVMSAQEFRMWSLFAEFAKELERERHGDDPACPHLWAKFRAQVAEMRAHGHWVVAPALLKTEPSA